MPSGASDQNDEAPVASDADLDLELELELGVEHERTIDHPLQCGPALYAIEAEHSAHPHLRSSHRSQDVSGGYFPVHQPGDVDEKCSDARRGFAAQQSVCEESDEEEDEDVPETEEEAKRQATYQASWFSKLTGGACAPLLLFECAELC